MNLIIDFLVISGLILGIWLFNAPRKAKFGNLTAAFALFCAFALILYRHDIIGAGTVGISLLLGALAGYVVARTVNMNQIPSMVAIQNGSGGAAAFLVSLVELIRQGGSFGAIAVISGITGLAVGAFTFSGSMIAAAKLSNKMRQAPQVLPGHNYFVMITVWGMLAACVISFHVPPDAAVYLYILQIVLASLLGILFSIRIGGADMPVLISFLNSMTGMAAALCGMVIGNRLLIAFGAVVAASGYILTYLMCKAMNRNLLKVFLPDPPKMRSGVSIRSGSAGTRASGSASTGTRASGSASAGTRAQGKDMTETPASPGLSGVPGQHPSSAMTSQAPKSLGRIEKDKTPGDPFARAAQILAEAQKVIVIPGYGMAIAQAQREVTSLAGELEGMGKDVKYAIHPVAGRMPGHMNVLLAEADVDYDMLVEMDEINPEFSSTGAVLVVGACDVVNPSAIEVEGTPISGMPILMAHEAKNVICCNFDEKPGYSGVENPLYKKSRTLMLPGNAKETVRKLTEALLHAGKGDEDFISPADNGDSWVDNTPAHGDEAIMAGPGNNRLDGTPAHGDEAMVTPAGDGDQGMAGTGADMVGTVANEDGEIDNLGRAVQALAKAKTVTVIPGYGMALAKAQFKLLELASMLSEGGASVKYAIHPVAGRMPGHMNVILAEAEVDYDDLLEMDDANPLFADTDVAMIIGACDVVNPAAIEIEGTPISGMPILMAHEAKQIIVCNFDENPGYSGVPNPIYNNSRTIMLPGDAKATLEEILAAIKGN
ncbi:MAG: NAD(P)(+) transhydrogenase (Re/Si-specific) subunit beta [Desulfamplus sp.]|nr:NAD(P)(+) transhydrogenase (Re/Si-specific) subunit beta [Desulfamplus sp.]